MSIETILAMLARGTSESEAEAIKSIESAYKRMQKEEITIFDLLERSKQDLYQNSMNRLADLIVKMEYPKEPEKQREVYAKLSYLIAQKFIPEGTKSESTQQGRTESSSRADEAQKAYDEARNKREEEPFKKQDERAYTEASRTQNEESQNKKTTLPLYEHFLMLNRIYIKEGLFHDLAHDLKNTLLLFSAGIAFGYVCCFIVGVIASSLAFPSLVTNISSGIALYIGSTSAINFGLWKQRKYD